METVRLTHLFICREYPPAAYPPGGIGTYVRHMAALLAAAGEMVHVVAHRWARAPERRQVFADGRLVVHRVALDDAVPTAAGDPADGRGRAEIPAALLASRYPTQAFSYQAAIVAERLIEHEGVDVVEAQEWEAPLYYLLARRAAGLGPSRQPPVVVHIHSPSARIFAANGWDTSVADFTPCAALEAYAIRHADAVLCPSRFIADEVTADYGLDPAAVTVIPYPLGDTAFVERDAATWEAHTVCHVGRLEPRKGVLEWAEAVAAVAERRPDVRFDFVGGDTPLAVTGGDTVQRAMLRRLPRAVRPRVRFLGTQTPSGVAAALAQASAAVVPSRWENFPYSCIEAMSSGLPVLVAPNGGMRELVTDGVSGWIARDGSPQGLADGLLRVLDTPGAERRRMGAAAAAAVRSACEPASVVARHLALKRGVAPRQPRADTGAAPRAHRAHGADTSWRVVTCAAGGQDTDAVSQALAMLSSPSPPAWIVLVDEGARIEPDALAACLSWLERDPALGLVAGWTRDGQSRVHVPPLASRPFVLEGDRPAPVVVVRAEALAEGRPGTRLATFEAIVDAEWEAAMYPDVLSHADRGLSARPSAQRYSSMTLAVQRLHTPLLRWLFECAPEDRRQFLIDGFAQPARSARWVAARLMEAAGDAAGRARPRLG